jgi:hypothetical protein
MRVLSPLASSHLGDSGMSQWYDSSKIAGVEQSSWSVLQSRMPAQDRNPAIKPPKT